VLNSPIRPFRRPNPRRIGLIAAYGSIVFLIALMLLRAWIIFDTTNGLATCAACMGATALQQDSTILAMLLACVALSFFFRRYWLQLPWLLFAAAILVFYAIDLIVLKTLSQRLYIFDVLKFGKEIGAISEFAGVFLQTPTGKIALAIAILGIVLVLCMLAARPTRPRVTATLLAMAITLGALGQWQPTTMAYIHYELLQNLITANLDLGVDKPYSAEFTARVKRDLIPETPVCAAGENKRPNVIFVLVESLSMHHSQLFGGERDLTPNIDALARQNTYLPNFYANGFTTDGGLIALLTGRAPVPAVGRYQSVQVFHGFDDPEGALPELLHESGYNVDFFTTGDLGFLDKTAWLRSLGFDAFEGAEQPFYNGWKRRHFNAAEDKALYQRFLQWLDQRQESSPYFAMLLTVSTHPPFINPETDAADEPGAFRYADKQIGMLYDELKKRDFFRNGILLISGDHRSMTPLFATEQKRFGDSALARVPMAIATDLPIQHGAISNAFQQTDLFSSLDDLTKPQACRTSSRGWFLREQPLPPSYVEHARGDKRDRVDIYFGDDASNPRRGEILLNGDNTRWLGDKPADWQHIMLRVATDRIARGANAENYLDYIIDLRKPTPKSQPH
jgi:lipoteichoic acid synthase